MAYETNKSSSDDQPIRLISDRYEYLPADPPTDFEKTGDDPLQKLVHDTLQKARSDIAASEVSVEALTQLATDTEPSFTEVVEWPQLQQRSAPELLEHLDEMNPPATPSVK